MTRTPITVASMFDIQCTSNWSSIPIWKHSYKSMNPSFCRNQSVHIPHQRLNCCDYGSSSCLSVSDFLLIHHLSCRLTSIRLLLHPEKERTPPAVLPPARHAGHRHDFHHDFHHGFWQRGDHAAVQPHQHPLQPLWWGAWQWQQLGPAVRALTHQGPRRWVPA